MSDLEKINSIFNAKIDSVKNKDELQSIPMFLSTVNVENRIKVPDVIGKSLKSAIKRISEVGLRVKISGSGQVVLQSADKTGFTGASSITTVGTIGTGTWQGTVIDKTYLDDEVYNTSLNSLSVDNIDTINIPVTNKINCNTLSVKSILNGLINNIIPIKAFAKKKNDHAMP